MRRHRRLSPGFTLLEMMLAMAMIAVLAGSLYASLRIGFRAREHAEAALRPVRAADIALDLLGRDLQCIPPPRGILAGAFTGQDTRDTASGRDTDSLTFFTRAMSTADAAPGIIGVQYALIAAGDGGDPSLVRSVTVNLLAPEQPAPLEEVVCRHATSFNVRYFDGTAWLDTWDSTAHGDTLPLSVEIIIEIASPAANRSEPVGHRYRQVVALPCYAGSQATTADTAVL